MTPPSESVYPEPIVTQEKLCTRCKSVKLLTDFVSDKRNKDGKGATCKKCERERYRESNARKSSTVYDENLVKTCLQCKTPKTISCFSKKPRGRYGVDARCKECIYSNNKKWRDNNELSIRTKKRIEYAEKRLLDPDFPRKLWKKRKLELLGIDEQWLEDKLKSQNGVCAICHTDKPGGNRNVFVVDHNHECCGDGRACINCRRDLLCFRCNVSLGIIENVEWFHHAIDYLDRHKINRSTSSSTSISLWKSIFDPLGEYIP